MNESIIQQDLQYITEQNIKWETFAGKTILITGANGIIGYYLVRTIMFLNNHYLEPQCKILALCRNFNRANEKFKDLLNRSDLELIIQDVGEKIDYKYNIDYIIHAASQASPIYFGSDPVGTLNANVFGTNNILQLSYEKKSEVLFFSSAEVYGETQAENIPTKEMDFGYLDPTNVRSCYAESKRLGETMCVSWYKQYAVPVKIVRPFHTYGPGILRSDGRVFSDFIFNIVDGKNLIMKSDGTARRTFCYLSDAIRGYFTVLLNGNNGEAYNIGNSSAEASILELANILIGLFPEKNLQVIKQKDRKINEYIESQISRSCPNIEKATAIGWNPQITIADGFKRSILSCL